MRKLVALLHFIMPSLFDSRDKFSEWFLKDIEGNAEKNGAMNEHQLRRLHRILKRFMLRIIQNELGDKVRFCRLSPVSSPREHELTPSPSRTDRNRRLLRPHTPTNIDVPNLTPTHFHQRPSLPFFLPRHNDDSVEQLMNLIVQFRKVCNHPELFGRADVVTPFAFIDFDLSSGATLSRGTGVLEVP